MTVAGGERRTVEIPLAVPAPGRHTVAVGGLEQNFVVWKISRPSNGTVLVNKVKGGMGRLTIKNGDDERTSSSSSPGSSAPAKAGAGRLRPGQQVVHGQGHQGWQVHRLLHLRGALGQPLEGVHELPVQGPLRGPDPLQDDANVDVDQVLDRDDLTAPGRGRQRTHRFRRRRGLPDRALRGATRPGRSVASFPILGGPGPAATARSASRAGQPVSAGPECSPARVGRARIMPAPSDCDRRRGRTGFLRGSRAAARRGDPGGRPGRAARRGGDLPAAARAGSTSASSPRSSSCAPTRSAPRAARRPCCAPTRATRVELHAWDTVKGSDFLADQDVVRTLRRHDARSRSSSSTTGASPGPGDEDGCIAQRPFGGHSLPAGDAGGGQDRLLRDADPLRRALRVPQLHPLRRVLRDRHPGRERRVHRPDVVSTRHRRDSRPAGQGPPHRVGRRRHALRLHHLLPDRHRRRHGDGLPGRPSAGGHGVPPVPSDGPGALRDPDDRGLPGRGRLPPQQQGRALHGEVRAQEDGAGAPRHGLAFHDHRDPRRTRLQGRRRPGLPPSRPHPPRRRPDQQAPAAHPRSVHEVPGHRPDQRADTDPARGPLLDGRHRDRHQRPDAE